MYSKDVAKDFVYSFKKIGREFCDFLKFLKENKLTCFLCCFFLLLSYGPKWIFYNISADTEIMINDYNGMTSSWTGIDRFGLVLTKKVLKLVPFNPFVANFLMLCTLFLLLMFICFTFSSIAKKFKNKAKHIFIFPCIFITHPVFAEQFNYTLQAFEVSFAIFLAFLASYLITRWIFDSKNLAHLFFGVVFLVWAFWSYQAILFLYVSLALALFVYTFFNSFRSEDALVGKIYNKRFFRLAAFKNIIVFSLSYIVYFLVNKITKTLLHVNSSNYLSSMVAWKNDNPFSILKNILSAIFGFLGIKIYFFIAIMILFIIFMCFNPKNKNRILFSFSVVTLCVSPAFLSFYLGAPAVPRTQFAMPFLFGFVFFLLMQFLYEKKLVKNLFLIFCLATAFSQSYRVAGMLYYEYMRYRYDVSIAEKIEEKIEEKISLLDIKEEKEVPVLFVGMLRSPAVPTVMRGHNVGVSFFEWHWVNDPTGVTHIALGFMKTLGFNRYRLPNDDECKKALEISKTMKLWPSPYSVKYEDGIIIVKLPEELSF